MRIKNGDLFSLGTHRLLCGDARIRRNYEDLIGSGKVDAVLTDPPYGVNYRQRDTNTRITGDNFDDFKLYKLVKETLSNAKEFCSGAYYIFFANTKISMMQDILHETAFKTPNLLVFVKNNFALGWADYHNQFELAFYTWPLGGKRFWCGSRKEKNVFPFKMSPNKLHPTMKPLETLQQLIRNSTPEEGSVLDMFAGSGSTGIAAEKEGRTAFLMELEPYYCQVILDRYERELGIKVEFLKNIDTDLPYDEEVDNSFFLKMISKHTGHVQKT